MKDVIAKLKKKKESYDLDYDILTIENYKMCEGWSRNPNEQKFNNIFAITNVYYPWINFK